MPPGTTQEMTMLSKRIAAVLCVLLAGCTFMGLAEPKTLSERIAYGYSVNAGVRQAAAQSVTAGTLSAEDGQHVLSLTDQARAYLDAARAVQGLGDTTTAEERLQLALAVLDEAQRYLKARVTR
jgi:hypothetical protein